MRDGLAPRKSKVLPRFALAFALTLLISLTPASACVELIQHSVASSIERIETYGAPEFKKLLFIADGQDFGWGSNLGESVAKADPHKIVVRSDILILNPGEKGNLTTVKADNTEPYPKEITQHLYDFIVMKEGMCICCTARGCGGVAYE